MKLLMVVTVVVVFCTAFNVVSGLAQEFEEHEQDKLVNEHVVTIEPAETNSNINSNDNSNDNSNIRSMIATAYCIDGTTASGTQTRQGIAAGKREWFGKTAKVYQNDKGAVGELIGQYVIEDTGGTPIKNGSVIDIWMPTYDECMNFGRRLVYVEIVD